MAMIPIARTGRARRQRDSRSPAATRAVSPAAHTANRLRVWEFQPSEVADTLTEPIFGQPYCQPDASPHRQSRLDPAPVRGGILRLPVAHPPRSGQGRWTVESESPSSSSRKFLTPGPSRHNAKGQDDDGSVCRAIRPTEHQYGKGQSRPPASAGGTGRSSMTHSPPHQAAKAAAISIPLGLITDARKKTMGVRAINTPTNMVRPRVIAADQEETSQRSGSSRAGPPPFSSRRWPCHLSPTGKGFRRTGSTGAGSERTGSSIQLSGCRCSVVAHSLPMRRGSTRSRRARIRCWPPSRNLNGFHGTDVRRVFRTSICPRTTAAALTAWPGSSGAAIKGVAMDHAPMAVPIARRAQQKSRRFGTRWRGVVGSESEPTSATTATWPDGGGTIV